MALWTALGLGAGATVGTAAAAVVVIGAVGYYVILPQFVEPDEDTTAAVEEAVVEPVEDVEDPPEIVEAEEAPAAEPEVETAEVVEEPAAPEAPPVPRVPTFDVVRVDAMGSALVAGIADANKVVDVLLDGDKMSDLALVVGDWGDSLLFMIKRSVFLEVDQLPLPDFPCINCLPQLPVKLFTLMAGVLEAESLTNAI